MGQNILWAHPSRIQWPSLALIEIWAWLNVLFSTPPISFPLYALEDTEVFFTSVVWDLGKHLQVTVGSIATFQVRNGCNNFFKLRNSNKEIEVIALCLKTQLSKNREHICQKVAQNCKLNNSHPLLQYNTIQFIWSLIPALLEEVLKCSIWQSTSEYWANGSSDI